VTLPFRHAPLCLPRFTHAVAGILGGIGLALGIGLFACSRPTPPPPHPDVVLIVVDTLRADRLTPFGNPGRLTSPRLQQLVDEDQAMVLPGLLASSSWTKPSMATIWSGLPPREHGVMRLQGKHARLEVAHSLPGEFQAGGYRTACVMSNFLLSRRMGAGFERGFQFWDDAPARHPDPHRGSTAAEVTDAGLAWLALQQTAEPDAEPLLLVLHYFDPHASFEDHAEVDFSLPDYQGWVTAGASTDVLREHEASTTAADREALRGWYDEEVWAVDRAIGRVVDALKAQGKWEQTVLMITADHGEELGERGHIGHTQSLMTELVDVPLLVRVPAAYRERWFLPQAADGGYAMEQLLPALLHVADLPLPAGLQLEAPEVLQTEVDFQPVRKDQEEKFVQQRAIRAQGMQLTIDLRHGQRLLFNLQQDPGMLHPLPLDHPAWKEMEALYAAQSFWERP